ncbi:hypothetical protein L484_000917 [Morus notabilis]|uniref:Uncharacterized protein n=1 Tax=Morus notabilis TaxID=981085 RepID=W9SER5_9ROSA|nr:hypothetical protein L484_000917 [Morus notabilis]
MDAGIFQAKRLFAIESPSRLGKYFKKLRHISDDKFGGISPENLLFPRLRISSFRQSTVSAGIWSTRLLPERESSSSSESRSN